VQREQEQLAAFQILVAKDAEHAAQRCAALIAGKARKAIAERGMACLAFSGGRTPWIMMQALARQELSWGDVHIFQADERVVPLDSPERTFAHLRQIFAPSSPNHVHPMPVDELDLAGAARRYGALLGQIVGVPPVLDVIHLGLGPDGHTASLAPGDLALNVRAADVAISGLYQGHRRMTLTYPILNRAEAIVWLVTGDSKAEVLQRLCGGDTEIPAGRVRRDRAVVVADQSAARLLRNDASAYDVQAT
jgi:6-phosphogluconolactonase